MYILLLVLIILLGIVGALFSTRSKPTFVETGLKAEDFEIMEIKES